MAGIGSRTCSQQVSRRASHPRVGFSLIELMVVIGIVAVIAGLTLRSLRESRRTAQSVECLATIAHWGSEAANLPSPQKEIWPNVWSYPEFVLGEDHANITYDFTFGLDYTGQAAVWHGAFLKNGWAPALGENGEQLRRPDRACPRLARVVSGAWTGVTGALESYMYSVALVTHPDLWDPVHPERRKNPRSWGRFVGIHEVRFPADKAVFFEKRAFHGDGQPVWNGGRRLANVAFADGHASLTSTSNASPPLNYYQNRSDQFGLPSDMRIPFNASSWGVRGVDRVMMVSALP